MSGGGPLPHYLVRRSARRTLALYVDHRGVRVHAPWRVPEAEVEAFVAQHRGWVETRLEALRAARARCACPLVDGMIVTVLGSPLRIHLDAGRRTSRWVAGEDGVEELRLPLETALKAFDRALGQRGLAWFRGRVEEYCLQLGVEPPRVALSRARARWGSCSRLSGIRLHWKLVLLAPAVADYVVAHEVAHLREMNHSRRFWAIVAALRPDWQPLRARLAEDGAALPEFEAPRRGGDEERRR